MTWASVGKVHVTLPLVSAALEHQTLLHTTKPSSFGRGLQLILPSGFITGLYRVGGRVGGEGREREEGRRVPYEHKHCSEKGDAHLTD